MRALDQRGVRRVVALNNLVAWGRRLEGGRALKWRWRLAAAVLGGDQVQGRQQRVAFDGTLQQQRPSGLAVRDAQRRCGGDPAVECLVGLSAYSCTGVFGVQAGL